MKNALLAYIKQHDITTVFTDYYDTIVHRKVHPNYTKRIWSKLMIREFGLSLAIDDLFAIRNESTSFLSKKLKIDENKIPYSRLIEEIFMRLVNSHAIDQLEKERFYKCCQNAEINSEKTVQFLNLEMVETLKEMKSRGLKIYLVSDYYASTEVLIALVKHHGIHDLFDTVYSSSSIEHSKESADIFPFLMATLKLKPEDVIMVGDNAKSDFENSKKHGLHAFLLPHQRYLRQNRRNNIGNDAKDYKNLLQSYYKQCKHNKAPALSEYILFFQVFTERLYAKCKTHKVQNLFFLSREGEYLKKLFDHYQQEYGLSDKDSIKTHYLRTSRQASFQISFKAIEDEKFEYLKIKFKNLSINDFLTVFNFSETIKRDINATFNFNFDTVIPNFFESEYFSELILNTSFIKHYENNRTAQKLAFETYIDSFNVDFKKEGLHLVDIGWGGTMQESLYKFFGESFKVTGYYLGLKEVYNIMPDTKRYGLIYSVYPVRKYKDVILDVNAQVYEQLLSAGHGSALGYNENAENFTLEYHEPIEKSLYDEHIKQLHDYMFEVFKSLTRDLEMICYHDKIVDNTMVDFCLKIGLFQKPKDLRFMNILNEKLYNNIGDNKIGIQYKAKDVGSMSGFLKTFLLHPEKSFRYLVKLKTMLYNKNKLLASLFPMYLVYTYIKFNKNMKEKVFKNYFYFKFSNME